VRKDDLRKWNSAAPGGLAFLCFFALLFVASVWADIEFLKPVSMVGVAAGAVWFLGGWHSLATSAGALGFLSFMVPWPTTLIDKIGFPLQLMSSSYAALFGGLCGLPIHRDGVQLSVVDGTGTKAIYSILVAQKCSGLTSLMVLLALGYLIAYHTEVKLGWRALMVALIIPLTLFTNAVRLTFILLAGAHSSAAMAQWIHDHEGPVLIFFCSLGLMAFRHGLLLWTHRKPAESNAAAVSQAPSTTPAAPSSMFIIPAQENEIAALPTADR
jgi:exosortase